MRQALDVSRGTASEEFTISGNGKQVRDVLFVSDAIGVYFGAVERIEQARGHAFNIGGGAANSLSLLELFQLLEREMEVRLRYCQLPVRQSDQKVFIADIRKATRLLGWTP